MIWAYSFTKYMITRFKDRSCSANFETIWEYTTINKTTIQPALVGIEAFPPPPKTTYFPSLAIRYAETFTPLQHTLCLYLSLGHHVTV